MLPRATAGGYACGRWQRRILVRAGEEWERVVCTRFCKMRQTRMHGSPQIRGHIVTLGLSPFQVVLASCICFLYRACSASSCLSRLRCTPVTDILPLLGSASLSTKASPSQISERTAAASEIHSKGPQLYSDNTTITESLRWALWGHDPVLDFYLQNPAGSQLW